MEVETKRIQKAKKEAATMFRYSLAGVLKTGLTVGMMAGFYALGLVYWLSSFISYLLGIVLAYYLNLFFTFRNANSGKSKQELFRMAWLFIVQSLFLTGLAQAVQHLVIEIAAWPEHLGMATGIITYGCVGYVINRLWLFKGSIHETKS